MERLVSLIDAENVASQKVALKNGITLQQKMPAVDGKEIWVFSAGRVSVPPRVGEVATA